MVGSLLPALLLAAALVLMGAERIEHLLPGDAAGGSVWAAALELGAATFMFLVVAFAPRVLRSLVGSGAPEERVRALLESGDDVVLVLDAGGQRILAVNARGTDLLGRRADELAGVAPVEIAPELGPARLAELVAPLVSGRAPWVRSETYFRRRDGSTWPVGIHLQWGRWLGAEVLVLVGVDLTTRKAAEEELRKSRLRLEAAQRVAGLATWEWDLARDRLTWSDELYRIFGREPGSFEPRFDKVLEAVHPDDRERLRAQVLEAIASRTSFDTRYRLVRASNDIRWMHVAARWEASEEGPGRLVGVSQDITRLREAEAAVKSSERRYRRLFEEAPVSLWEEDLTGILERLEALRLEGVTDLGAHLRAHPKMVQELAGLVRIRDVNPATLQLFGLASKDELASRFKLEGDEHSERAFLKTLEALFEGRSHLQVTTKERGPDGKVRDLLIVMNLPESPEHQGTALVSVVDLSERLAAAEALREREAELSRALAAARMGIWEWNVATGRVAWSKEVHAIFGSAAAGFDGSVESYMSLIHPDDVPILQGDIERAIRSGGDYHTEVRLRPDPEGRISWMAGAGKMEFDADGRPRTLRGLVWDVTAQRAAEQALRESEARLTSVVEHAPVVLFAVDTEGRFTLSEGRTLHALGLRPGEVVGRSAFDFYAGVPQIVNSLRAALTGQEIVATVPVGGLVFDTRYRPLRDAAGQITGAIGVDADNPAVVQDAAA
ncbi:MAG: PAS domain S-box protein, partial [Gemmatimonadetes bacterium]|nr:PAS domain S-box protein [Gemmatimonadota bacterium]